MKVPDSFEDDFSSEQIVLFPLTEENMSPSYPDWLNDPHVNRFLVGDRSRQTEKSCRVFIRDCEVNPDVLLLGIRTSLRGRPAHVGNVKFSAIRTDHKTAEIGLLIGEKSLWGKGLGRKALQDAQLIARRFLTLRKLTAGILATNEASQRTFSHAGFTTIGIRRGQFLLDGRPEDEILMESFV